jgi:thiamine biosynthesis lipoprotein ApbE
MAADGISTAAFVLGRSQAGRFLEAQGVRALLIATDGEQVSVNL